MTDELLAGTSAELQPGVGGTGDHPTPAAMVGEDGNLHVAGEGVNAPPSNAPEGDTTDVPAGDEVTDPEAWAKLHAVTEPEPLHTERPDLGTPDEEER